MYFTMMCVLVYFVFFGIFVFIYFFNVNEVPETIALKTALV